MNKHLLGAVSALVLSVTAAQAGDLKYVFMMIGDGMAMPQRNAAEVFLAAMQDDGVKPGIVSLSFGDFPVQGMSTTYSLNSLITDSAAAGTALATGYKTNSGVISMDASGQEAYKSIAFAAHDVGFKVGIVSSVSIDHATPAVYYATAPSRNDYYGIAQQLPASGFEYFAGGAVKKPTNADNADAPSFYDTAEKAGYTIVDDREGFAALQAGVGKVYAENPVRTGGNALPYAIDADESSISLAEFTQKGIDLLSDDKFFMMVEGGKIDWACHANDPHASIGDTIAFDEAVRVALDFYNEHPDETLIITTGDHETGGMTLGFAATKYETFIPVIEKQTMSYETFTNAIGEFKKANPDAVFEDAIPLIEKAYGIEVATLEPYEAKALQRAFAQTMVPKAERNRDDQELYMLYGGYEPLAMALDHLVSSHAGLGWTTYSHTGVPVPVSAIGNSAEAFSGYYDNTDIAKRLFDVMGLEM